MASSTNEAVQPATTYAEATEAEKHAVLRKVTGSSFLGNFIEWFDYASYSYLATVIAMVFFPAEDRAVAVMSTFGVFALSFLVRPIGAIFWGNMGDKKGRKWALSVSILLMSGVSIRGSIPPNRFASCSWLNPCSSRFLCRFWIISSLLPDWHPLGDAAQRKPGQSNRQHRRRFPFACTGCQ